MITALSDILTISDAIAPTIPQISETTNFWMIRSKKGVFYSEYISQSFIAIGWNALLDSTLSSGHDDDYYKGILRDNSYPDKQPGTALNKCRRFIYELKEGDIAMIVGRDEITFAKIGEYYEESDPSLTTLRELEVSAQIDSGTYLGFSCPYIKRRKISIIATVGLDSAPPMVYKCLVSNRHSLSALNDYADSILSCCYDLVYYYNRLIIKYHVRQPRDINPLDFSLFTYLVTSLITEDRKIISGKYNLNSEGDIVLFLLNQGNDALEFIKEHLMSIIVIYFTLFGGKVGGVEFPSAIGAIKSIVGSLYFHKETKRLKIAEADNTEVIVKKTTAETEKIRAETEKIRAETEEIQNRLQERANKTVDDLRQAASQLNIKPPSNKIIDISALFQDYDETE